ncbi:MAG: B12-binding domain-containing radical SAM protein [Acidobacteria bacterium]|nr:B12-binding domain-containing radical SAM protein [Acidobacteriota bacterium]
MKKIKIALAFIFNDDIPGTMEELGISIITSVLRQKEYEVLLFSAHEHRVNYEEIKQYDPGIIGLTIYRKSKNSVYRVIHKLKEILPKVIICLGGTDATINSQEIWQENSAVDFIVKGEGEETFLDLVTKINNNEDYSAVKGISYRRGSIVIENDQRAPIADLDKQPFAARDILFKNRMQIALISTSRGCKSQCSFCLSKFFWNKWRGRSVGNVVDELEYIVKQYGVKVFNFIDSSFEDPGKNLDRISAIAQEIIKRGLEIYYFADVRAEIHKKLTPAIMELLKKSGLWAICIGLEAGNPGDLRLYKKIAAVEDNCRAIELFQQYGIGVNPGFINFNPYTTLERLQENIDFLYRYRLSIRFISRLILYKGTSIFNKLQKENMLYDETEYGYRYQDKKIAQFSDFLFKYIDNINKSHDYAFYHLDYFNVLFFHEMILYRQILTSKNDEAGLQKLDIFLNEHQLISQNFNHIFTEWIKSLLAILAAGEDYEKLYSCTNDLMPVSKFLDAHKKFSNLKKKLLLYLSRSGYSSILINI